MAEEAHRVTLNVYDLSQGLARQLSATFLGKVIEGIWYVNLKGRLPQLTELDGLFLEFQFSESYRHTGVVVYGNEYYFGGGIQHAPAGSTPYGTPVRVIELGETHVPEDVFEMYLQEISPRYTAENYSLLTHNCNNFSHEISQFLVGKGIPHYILQLPNEVMSSPMASLIMPMIQNIEGTLKVGAIPQVPQFRPQSQPLRAFGKDEGPRPPTKPNDTKSKREEQEKKPEEAKTSGAADQASLAAKPDHPKDNVQQQDPLGEARNKVQEEIAREFAAIMAQGTLRASEAAALATRKVMQKYGHLRVPSS